MVANGGLISDFTSGTGPDRNNFPRRNRIIAGLADAVLVIEAAAKGGALITAGIASSYDREVMAVPGRVNDEVSAGTNQMIRDNKAALVTGYQDVLAWLGWEPVGKQVTQTMLFTELPSEQRLLVDSLRAAGESSIDHLAFRSGLSVSRVSALLFELELKSLVRSLPGKIYRLR
jgi:DNA processing protein